MVELTFQVTQDGTFTAEASEVYAGEEKRTVEGDAVSLAYNPFQDIENHWAKEEILKAYHEGLFQGVTETKFIPEGNPAVSPFTLEAPKLPRTREPVKVDTLGS